MWIRRSFCLLPALAFAPSPGAQELIRSYNPNVREVVDLSPRAMPALGARAWSVPAWTSGAPLPQITAVARQGLAMPAGETGTLTTVAFADPVAIDSQGRLTFFSLVDGAQRNQGIFVADGSHLKAIAIGCGAGGGSGSTDGCGDPSPIGGTFSGMFLGTVPAPTVNDLGDVLFVADVTGGSSPRGLFLYRADSQSIIKIAAIGDTSPRGGTLSGVGPGSINNHRVIVFLATTGASHSGDVLLWKDGVVSTYAAAGDIAPGGETFLHIASESFNCTDGTWIPSGPAPAINDDGLIAFGGTTPTRIGLLTSRDGVHEWQVRDDDPIPDGGVFFDFRLDPVLNGRGDIAFLAYTADAPGAPPTGSAWYVGSHGNFRRVLGGSDTLLGGHLNGLAFSRNPFRPLDDAGNLALWARVEFADASEQEHMLVARPDGTLDVIASQGVASPVAGTWGMMNPWPTANRAFQIGFGAATPGYPESTDAQFVATHFLDTVFRDGFDNP